MSVLRDVDVILTMDGEKPSVQVRARSQWAPVPVMKVLLRVSSPWGAWARGNPGESPVAEFFLAVLFFWN